jgi:hypothetical protein
MHVFLIIPLISRERDLTCDINEHHSDCSHPRPTLRKCILAARNRQRTLRIQRFLAVWNNRGNNAKEKYMISKVLSGAVIAGLMLAISAPVVAYAEDAPAPKTKADCKKAKDMKWDKTTNTCVKK